MMTLARVQGCDLSQFQDSTAILSVWKRDVDPTFDYWKTVLFSAGVVSNVVRHVVVPIVNRPRCNEYYEKIADKVKLQISEDMTCAGIETGGRDACQVNAHLNPC